MLRLSQDRFIFEEATSSRFFRVTTSTQQYSYFVGTAISKENLPFLWGSFFRTVTYSLRSSYFLRTAIFQNKTSTVQPVL